MSEMSFAVYLDIICLKNYRLVLLFNAFHASNFEKKNYKNNILINFYDISILMFLAFFIRKRSSEISRP